MCYFRAFWCSKLRQCPSVHFSYSCTKCICKHFSSVSSSIKCIMQWQSLQAWTSNKQFQEWFILKTKLPVHYKRFSSTHLTWNKLQHAIPFIDSNTFPAALWYTLLHVLQWHSDSSLQNLVFHQKCHYHNYLCQIFETESTSYIKWAQTFGLHEFLYWNQGKIWI